MSRIDGRTPDQLRPVTIERAWSKHAEGSVLVSFGDTKVLCTATVTEGVPRWRKGGGEGWVTAEYAMLPRSTNTRGDRESVRGRIGGRTHEISRLVGRSLRACIDTKALGENTVVLDCDVLQADGGTRTAAITGAYVALADAVSWLSERKKLAKGTAIVQSVAAVSVGVIDGEPRLDLAYEEDVRAGTDMNVVCTGDGGFVEVLGTRNAGKLAELQRLLTDAVPGVEVLGLRDVEEYPEAPETGATFADNALLKAREAVRHTGLPAVADDSGIAVDALNGMPGILSARWSGRHGDDDANTPLLLGQLADVPDERRGAAFVCAAALVTPDGVERVLERDWRGAVVRQKRGSNGFGYDPVFVPAGLEQTAAELAP